jgi:hypothetical protein
MDPIDRQAAIDLFPDDDLEWDTYFGYVAPHFAKRMIKELPSGQPEQTDCCYCHEDSDGYVTPLEKNCHAFIRFGMNGWCLNLQANKWHGETKINYCPMCGRELKHG